MTFFFNIETLENVSCDNPVVFLSILQNFYHKKLPHRTKGPHYSRANMVGSSFLLNPEPLFKNKWVDILYKIQYIKLASKRDYALYKYYDIKSLQLSYFPDVNLEVIKTNPLLKITSKEIFFCYEEAKKERKWH
jgi:hypothetical protein